MSRRGSYGTSMGSVTRKGLKAQRRATGDIVPIEVIDPDRPRFVPRHLRDAETVGRRQYTKGDWRAECRGLPVVVKKDGQEARPQPAVSSAGARRSAEPTPSKKPTTAKPGSGEPAKGGMTARRSSTCSICGHQIQKGSKITKYGDDWTHPDCAEAQHNTVRVQSGETFRSRRPSTWRLGASPGSLPPTTR